MNDEVQSGLEGVVAFATEIAEPDKEGSALRYRGVDIEDLVGVVPFEKVWGLLVDGSFDPGLAPATRGWTSSPLWPCWRPSGACASSSTSPSAKHATTSREPA